MAPLSLWWIPPRTAGASGDFPQAERWGGFQKLLQETQPGQDASSMQSSRDCRDKLRKPLKNDANQLEGSEAYDLLFQADNKTSTKRHRNCSMMCGSVLVQWFPQTPPILCLAYDPCTAHIYRLEVGGRPGTNPKNKGPRHQELDQVTTFEESKVTAWIHKFNRQR